MSYKVTRPTKGIQRLQTLQRYCVTFGCCALFSGGVVGQVRGRPGLGLRWLKLSVPYPTWWWGLWLQPGSATKQCMAE